MRAGVTQAANALLLFGRSPHGQGGGERKCVGDVAVGVSACVLVRELRPLGVCDAATAPHRQPQRVTLDFAVVVVCPDLPASSRRSDLSGFLFLFFLGVCSLRSTCCCATAVSTRFIRPLCFCFVSVSSLLSSPGSVMVFSGPVRPTLLTFFVNKGSRAKTCRGRVVSCPAFVSSKRRKRRLLPDFFFLFFFLHIEI